MDWKITLTEMPLNGVGKLRVEKMTLHNVDMLSARRIAKMNCEQRGFTAFDMVEVDTRFNGLFEPRCKISHSEMQDEYEKNSKAMRKMFHETKPNLADFNSKVGETEEEDKHTRI